MPFFLVCLYLDFISLKINFLSEYFLFKQCRPINRRCNMGTVYHNSSLWYTTVKSVADTITIQVLQMQKTYSLWPVEFTYLVPPPSRQRTLTPQPRTGFAYPTNDNASRERSDSSTFLLSRSRSKHGITLVFLKKKQQANLQLWHAITTV